MELPRAKCNFANPASGALLKPTITAAQNRGGGWVDESLRAVNKNRDFNSEALGAYAQDLVQLSPSSPGERVACHSTRFSRMSCSP